MTQPSVEVVELSKRYRQYADRGALLQRFLHPTQARLEHHIWALKGVTFDVEPGGTLGVIGRNGSGKTTLLRLLAGVSAPTSGSLRVVGRIAPLIGVGVGFNQELTGRENVFVNGRLLGMDADEVTDKFDRIVEFSELEDFVDVPVKFYSSGMFLRLAFSVAIHTDPDVILIDEILAVGDVGFQSKCFDRMRELQERGATVVLVTHNLQVLQRLTKRTLVLDHGHVRFDGGTDEAMEVYHEVLQDEQRARPGGTGPSDAPSLEGTADVDLKIVSDRGATLAVEANRELRLRVTAGFEVEVDDPIVTIMIERPGVGLLWAAAMDPSDYRGDHGPDRPLIAEVTLGRVPLLTGTYRLRAIVQRGRRDVALGTSAPTLFHVTSDRAGAGTVDFAPTFTVGGRTVRVNRPRLRDTS